MAWPFSQMEKKKEKEKEPCICIYIFDENGALDIYKFNMATQYYNTVLILFLFYSRATWNGFTFLILIFF